GGSWLQFGEAAGMAGDQAADDARSYTCDWELDEALEIVGTPTVRATLTSDHDRAAIAARLCDVAPDGRSRLATIGLFNLTHLSRPAPPPALTPGAPVAGDFPRLATAPRFAAGHRLRLSISASFWPTLWPSPETTLITVDSPPELSLPIRTVASVDDDARTSAEVTAQLGTPPCPPVTDIDADGAPMTRQLSWDLVGCSATMTTVSDD